MRNFFFSTLICCILPLVLQAGPKLSLQSAQEAFDFQDPIVIELELEFPEEVQPDFGAIRNSLSLPLPLENPLQLTSERFTEENSERGQKILHVQYNFLARETGPLFFRAVDIPFFSSDGKIVKDSSNILTIQVVEPPPDEEGAGITEGLRTLDPTKKGYLNEQNRQKLIEQPKAQSHFAKKNLQSLHESELPWNLIFGGLLFFFLGTALFFLIRRKNKPGKLALKTPVDPQKIALQELKKLAQEKLPSQGLFELFYVRVSSILRSYIEGAYGLKAPESTTEEFLQALLEDSSFDRDTRTLLEEFLSYADLVKFAKLSPDVASCDKALQTAESFIRQGSAKA